MLTKAQADGGNTEKNSEIWQSLPCSNCMDTVKLALPEDLQVTEGRINENRLRYSILWLPRRMTPTVQKLPLPYVGWDQYICMSEREYWSGIRKLMALYRGSYPHHYEHGYCACCTTPSLLDYSRERWLYDTMQRKFFGHVWPMMHIQRTPTVSRAQCRG